MQFLSSEESPNFVEQIKNNVVIECGWGRLIFGHTFTDIKLITEILLEEKKEQRDIALYLRDPHIVLSYAPQELFLDPSHTYRLWFDKYRAARILPRGFSIRKIQRQSDTDAINHILKKCQMVPVDPEFIWKNRDSSVLTYIVAEDPGSGKIIGTIMGIDHHEAFNDPERGSSLWCLAVDPQTPYAGVGQALVAYLSDLFITRGCSYLDLSVMHDNKEAIKLYEKMGFVRVPIFCIKRKNPINEQLFVGPVTEEKMNPYAEIIINEARRRGISVKIIDAEEGYFELVFGGRSIKCHESLSELTTAVAMSICANKIVTQRRLQQANLDVPVQTIAAMDEDNNTFLDKYHSVVVKPYNNEQGRGITVNVTDKDALKDAVNFAGNYSSKVIIEQFVEGEDLRIVVIDYKVVAAAVRRPPVIVGDGHSKIVDLIKKQSRRRQAATDGESSIPLDKITTACIEKGGYEVSDILPVSKQLKIRETANLHTGGTIHDVTEKLHPTLRNVAEKAARVLTIPVVGLDMIVKDVADKNYVIIEANERVGLANHEPQPTAERFIDFLFPQTTRA